MPETQQVQADGIKVAKDPLVLRSRVLRTLGWTLLVLSLALLSFHVLWMWKRMGTGAPLVGIGLLLDALVGVGLIIVGNRTQRKR
jgi:hypothetical protein